MRAGLKATDRMRHEHEVSGWSACPQGGRVRSEAAWLQVRVVRCGSDGAAGARRSYESVNGSVNEGESKHDENGSADRKQVSRSSGGLPQQRGASDL